MSVTESDMEDWAALWAEEPSREEQHELARVARRASWRGTLIEYADLGFAICIALCILGAIALQPQPATLAIGLLSAGGLFWSSKKRHMLRQATLLAEARDRVVLLEHEIARTSAEHKRAAIGMWATPLVILSGAMLAYLLTHSGSLAGFGASLVESMTEVPVGPAITAGILALIYQQVLLAQQLKRGLGELRSLQGAYREEARLDGFLLG